MEHVDEILTPRGQLDAALSEIDELAHTLQTLLTTRMSHEEERATDARIHG
jgi:hypothetical protein